MVNLRSKKESASSRRLLPSQKQGLFRKKKKYARSEEVKDVPLDDYEPPTPPSSEDSASPVHHIVTTEKELNEDNETHISDLTADRTYKRAVEQYQLEQLQQLQQQTIPEDAAVLDPPGEVIRSESGAANTIMGSGNDMEGAEVVVGGPRNNQDPSFISRIFGVVDQACSPVEDTPNNSGIQKVLSFTPEWGVAPEEEDDETKVASPPPNQWKTPETYSIALTRDHQSMVTGPIQPPQRQQQAAPLQTAPQPEYDEEEDRDSPPPSTTGSKQGAWKATSPPPPRAVTPTFDTSERTVSPTNSPDEEEHFELVLDEANLGRNDTKSTKAKRGWMNPFRSKSYDEGDTPVVTPKNEARSPAPAKRAVSPAAKRATSPPRSFSPNRGVYPSPPRAATASPPRAPPPPPPPPARNMAPPAKETAKVTVKSRKAILAAAKIKARRNQQKRNAAANAANSESSSNKSAPKAAAKKPLPPMPPVQPLPGEEPTRTPVGYASTTTTSRSPTTTTSHSFSSGGSSSKSDSYRSKSPALSSSTHSGNSSNSRLPPVEPVVEPDEFKQQAAQPQQQHRKRGFLQKVRSFGNNNKDIKDNRKEMTSKSTPVDAPVSSSEDSPKEARLKQVLVAFHGASKGPLPKIVEDDESNSTPPKNEALQVRVPGGGGAILSDGDLIGNEVVDDEESESDSDTDYDDDDEEDVTIDESLRRSAHRHDDGPDDEEDNEDDGADEDEEIRQLTARMAAAPATAVAAAAAAAKAKTSETKRAVKNQSPVTTRGGPGAASRGNKNAAAVSKATPLMSGTVTPVAKEPSPTPDTSSKIFRNPVHNMEASENTEIEAIESSDIGKTKSTWKERLGIRKVRSNNSGEKKVTVETSSASPIRRQLSAPDRVDSNVSESKTTSRKKKSVWKVAKDPNTGREYYYHRVTRKSTWSKPPELVVTTEPEEESSIKRIVDLPPSKASRANPVAASNRNKNNQIGSNAATKATARASADTKGKENARNSKSTQQTTNTLKLKDNGKSAKPKDPVNATRKASPVDSESTVRQKREKIARLLQSMSPPNGDSIERVMVKYEGREDELLAQLRDLKNTAPFDEPSGPKNKARRHLDPGTSSAVAPMEGPTSMTHRVQTATTFRSGASGLSRISETTPQIKNTSKGRKNIAPIMEDASQATSISSKDNHNLSPKRPVIPFRSKYQRNGRVPSKVPVPRSRELEVEEFTDEFRRTNIRGVVRAARKAPAPPRRTNPVPPPDGHESLDDRTFDASTISMPNDDISALSMTDNEFMGRGVGTAEQEAARRRAFDDAVAREDWDLAAALSEGMRALKKKTHVPSPPPSRREWTQTELDRFISENDWDAVANYIAKVRANNKASGSRKSSKSRARARRVVDDASASEDDSQIRKRFGARSQLQHADMHSYSSWESSSYDESDDYSSGSDSSEYRRYSSNQRSSRNRGRRGKEFAC